MVIDVVSWIHVCCDVCMYACMHDTIFVVGIGRSA